MTNSCVAPRCRTHYKSGNKKKKKKKVLVQENNQNEDNISEEPGKVSQKLNQTEKLGLFSFPPPEKDLEGRKYGSRCKVCVLGHILNPSVLHRRESIASHNMFIVSKSLSIVSSSLIFNGRVLIRA